MEKTINQVSRIFFGAILGLFLVALGVGECIFLVNSRKSESVISSGLSDGQKLTVAAQAEENIATAGIETKVMKADARPLIIQRYLEKYNSPLLPYAQEIFDLSEAYGFEYYWIVAIAQQESNLCKKIPEDSHNCWGYGIHKNGTLKFENYDLALKSYAAYLKKEYFDKGLNTPELIMKKYCPSSNGSWAYGVNHFIEEMENGV